MTHYPKIIIRAYDVENRIGGDMRTARIATPELLGAILREARFKSGLTQREMAARLGVSQKYVVQLEAGTATKAIERLFDYAAETGVVLYAEVDDE